ncbi:hypothetical protein PV783_22505 [Chitinophaga sp. CC14]|uniref:hypothetical protein n=1 Tax=Chitinophaga sp. CC14 TaxID=3029199 RepID=UPI003B7819C3
MSIEICLCILSKYSIWFKIPKTFITLSFAALSRAIVGSFKGLTKKEHSCGNKANVFSSNSNLKYLILSVLAGGVKI